MTRSNETTKQRILHEMSAAIAGNDRESTEVLLDFVRAIEPAADRADVLNQLLMLPGHELHQALLWEIQQLRSPSSVPFIRQILKDGFGLFEYTRSESSVIAKWFSHALAEINTPEAISAIKEFCRSDNAGVAKEMAYRLTRLNT